MLSTTGCYIIDFCFQRNSSALDLFGVGKFIAGIYTIVCSSLPRALALIARPADMSF